MTTTSTQQVPAPEARFIYDLVRPMGPNRTGKVTAVLNGHGPTRTIEIDVATDAEHRIGFDDQDKLHSLVSTMRAGLIVDVFLMLPEDRGAPPQMAAWTSEDGRLRTRTAEELKTLQWTGDDVSRTRFLDAWPVRL